MRERLENFHFDNPDDATFKGKNLIAWKFDREMNKQK